MAEIKIEKKKPIWPWIVLLLVIALAAILYFMNQDEIHDEIDEVDDIENIDDADDMDDVDDIDDIANIKDELEDNETVAYGTAYSQQEADRVMTDYRSSLVDSTKLGTDLYYTKNTFTQLAKAVEIKANQFNVNAKQTIDSLKMGFEPTATASTDINTKLDAKMFKSMSKQLVDVLKKIQIKQFANLSDEITELRMATNDINENMELTQQQSKLTSFFNMAADLINNMN